MVTSVAARPRTRRRSLSTLPTLAAPLVIAAGIGALAVSATLGTVVVVVGAVAVAVVLVRVEVAALVFVALEPFEGYAKSLSGASIKLLGALVFISWLLRALARPRTLRLAHPVLRAAAVLTAILLAATVVHPNGALGAEVLGRYLSYLAVLVVLVDTMQERLPPARVARVYVGSCVVAAALGLASYFGGALRAAGPVGDANDFAFFLLAALPLALGLRAGARRRWPYTAAATLLFVAILATISRGALVGLAAMLGYALLTGRVRVRAVLAGLAVVAATLGIVLLAAPTKLTTSLHAKDVVAAQNVNQRLIRWRAAAEMTADHPLLGLGPAGFRENFQRYIDFQGTDPVAHLDVAHETYLEVSAELGIGGLVAFVAVLALGLRGAVRRSRRPARNRADTATARLADAVCVAMVGTAVAAVFLTEQYYLPLWLLAAVGAALDPTDKGNAR